MKCPLPCLGMPWKTVLGESLFKGKMRAQWTILSLDVCWRKTKFSKHVSSVVRGSDPSNVLIDGDNFNEYPDELDFSFAFAPFTKDNFAIALYH